jgi:large subunit ribosomal protein L23
MSILEFAKKISGRENQRVKPTADVTKKNAKKKSTTKIQLAGNIGLYPLITEKAMLVQALGNAVVFRVKESANKKQIAKAVTEKYGVEPVNVRVVIMKPKARRRGRTEGTTKSWKKAYVTLPEGKTIDVTV